MRNSIWRQHSSKKKPIFICSGGVTSNIKEAVNSYRKSIELNPLYLGSYFLLGELFYLNNQYHEALVVYNEAQQYFPENAEIHFAAKKLMQVKKEGIS